LYPDLFKTILVPKAPELTAAPERFDGNKERAKEHFESGFRKAFTTLREKMDPRFPLTVYYAFKQEDEKAGSDEDDNGDGEGSSNGVDLTTGWETLLDALLGSGFQITATWPVRASQKWRMVAMGTNALASYIVLACRVRPASAPQCSRREFLNDLKKELPAALKHLQQGNIAPVDLAQAAIGPGMAVFSRYAKVVESSGNPMTVRTALALINQMLDEVLAEQEAEFDADTRWALAWFDQHGTEEGEFGVAETLSRAKNTAVNGLVQAGIVAARGGKVRLVKRNELPEDWDPASDNRLTVWEATQHLIRALDQRGESGAADLLRKMGGAVGETARELSYRLHKVCEGKGWSGEAQAYNSLVLAWPELTSLAQATPSAKQLNLPE
jgi:putative DNA methylase